MRKCESCGKSYTDDRDIICPHCGAVSTTKCTSNYYASSNNSDLREFYGNGDFQSDGESDTKNGSFENTIGTFLNKAGIPYSSSLKELKNRSKQTARKNGGNTLIAKIIFVCVVLFSVIPALLGFFSDLTDVDFSGVESVYTPVAYVGEATVNIKEAGDAPFYYVNIDIEDFYFLQDSEYVFPEEKIKLISDYAFGDITRVISDISEYTMSADTSDSFADMNYLEYGEFGDGKITYGESGNFYYGDIVQVNSVVLEFDETELSVVLPFDAFSCAEDGTVTYYTVEDEQVFTECEPKREYSECYAEISFDKYGYSYNDGVSSVEATTN